MPLARTVLLPQVLVRFRQQFPVFAVRILDGTYDALLGGLRRGSIDFLIGALRDPAPIGDVIQERLFDDRLAILARPEHPLSMHSVITIEDLLAYPWVVPRQGTPTRSQFETIFTSAGTELPKQLIETGSLLLMRGVLTESDHLGCISRHQSQAETNHGLLRQLPYPADQLIRPIGLTYRENWRPTRIQARMVDLVTELAPKVVEY